MTPAETDLLESPYESTHIADVHMLETDDPWETAHIGVFVNPEDRSDALVTMHVNGPVMTPAAARKLADALLRAAVLADAR